ncbi:alpha/beta fold hydrolase [Pseudomonas sp. TMP25]|uniref:alpha/beta hydrolase n=1 Tax=Pseudomonas sp. TMP25 TaxID=3136561 RepID=UPI0031010A79
MTYPDLTRTRLGCFCLLLVLLLSACTAERLKERRAASVAIASEAGWQRMRLDAGAFVLTAFAPPTLKQVTTLTVYIEGDGLAWISASTPSQDPTPLNPLGLKLALRDPSGAAVYLARPCQFVAGPDKRGCQQKYWTNQRFAPEVITASLNAIEQLKQRYGAERLVLVGYSGGSAVASLVAARRQDIQRLITVAGNLDHQTWTQEKRLSPLKGSLNPADAWENLQSVPQTHFVGGQDTIIGPSISRAYAARFPPTAPLTIKLIPTFDHHCCWAERWPNLLQGAMPAK